MVKPTTKQISTVITGGVLLGIVGMLAYAAVTFNPNKQPIGYIGQPAMSNYKVSSGAEKTYRGEYVSKDWSGLFDCYPVSANGYVNLASPCFAAGASSPLDAQAVANTRKIGTRTDAIAPSGIEFLYPNLTAAQKLAVVNAANVDFVRGTSLAPAGLRARTTVLGDIIHSRPYYYTDGTSPTVFVGANDGMLHAFDATTGDERWAYVPSMLLPKLPALSATGYASAHQYYVDGSMAIGKAGTKTVLVGALGAGGKGLYALDISSLTAANGAAAGSKGLWEVTNAKLSGPLASGAHAGGSAYLNMGDTYSNPIIVPTQDGSDAVIVGNGYNNTGDGCAYLYVINAQDGNLIKSIAAGACSATSPNGLSSPTAIDSNGDGKADRVYAGDVDGNLWAFDLSNPSSAAWSASKLFATGQSITQAPVVGVHPVKGFMVNFSTGRMLSDAGAAIIPPSTAVAPNDSADTITPYAAYGVWDNLSATTITNAQIINQALATRIYQPTAGATGPGVKVRMLTTDNKPNWTGATPVHRGWKTTFAVAGERVVGDGAFLLGGKFQFNVSNPTISYAVGAKGENWTMALDYLTGGAGTTPFLNLDRSVAIDDFDRIKYSATDTLPPGKAVGDPNIAASGIPVAYATSNGVQSQPILVQLSQASVPLFNQNFNAGVVDLTPPDAVGIGGGHFDAESFYHKSNNEAAGSTRSSTVGVVADFAHKKHDHEYDKKWNVNGLNLLNPSGKAAPPAHWLGESVNTTTPYKVLVFNQAWNPAAEVKIGAGDWVSTKDYQTQDRASVIAALQTYTGNTETIVVTTPPLGPITTFGTGNITSMQVRMPYNAFAVNDWWGNGVKINGLIPLDSSCVKGSGVPAGNGFSLLKAVAVTTGLGTDNERNPYIGLNGERHDGALTIQVIRADTPAASIVLNVDADVTIEGVVVAKEKFGYRVRNTDINKYVMHEEAVFWHHDVSPCMSGVAPGKATTTAKPTIAARPILAAKTGAPASCTAGGTIVKANPLTCKLVSGMLVYTPASCTTGTYTRPKPSYPEYPATPAITGWSPAMPLDRSDSEGTVWPNPANRPCGTNDPHDVSFMPSSAGGASGGGASGGGASAFSTNTMGGLYADSADGTGAGGTLGASNVASASSVGNPGTVVQTPPNNVPRRLTWRELIGQ